MTTTTTTTVNPSTLRKETSMTFSHLTQDETTRAVTLSEEAFSGMLSAVFQTVQEAAKVENWKAPMHGTYPRRFIVEAEAQAMAEVVVKALAFFVGGGKAEVREVDGAFKVGFQTAGYYAQIGA